MRDKQAQAQAYLADLDVQHRQLQEACAAQDTQDDHILLLEVKSHCLAVVLDLFLCMARTSESTVPFCLDIQPNKFMLRVLWCGPKPMYSGVHWHP